MAEVSAECLFADPIADIAVLGLPDYEEFSEEAEAYHDLLSLADPFSISDAPLEGSAWLYSLDGRWFRCRVWRMANGPLWVTDACEEIAAGMSGSPVRAEDGSVIGVVCAAVVSNGRLSVEHGPNPAVTLNLPAWLLRKLAWRSSVCPVCSLAHDLSGGAGYASCVLALRSAAEALERRAKRESNQKGLAAGLGA